MTEGFSNELLSAYSYYFLHLLITVKSLLLFAAFLALLNICFIIFFLIFINDNIIYLFFIFKT